MSRYNLPADESKGINMKNWLNDTLNWKRWEAMIWIVLIVAASIETGYIFRGIK